MRRQLLAMGLAAGLAACSTTGPDALRADALLLGEQHDASAHPVLQREWVARLASQGRLAALALEMAERGTGTAGLAASASEADVQQALRWNDRAWPWKRYGPVVMTAVRAGVPVLGANLPRESMRPAMADAQLDARLDASALRAQREAIREGHCDLLPATQLGPMVRVQIARDLAMARTLEAAARPERVVVLIAGAGHVAGDLGVPRHLPPGWRVRSIVLPQEDTGQDHCADLRRQMAK